MAERSRFVAASNRTSACRVWFPPTRSKVRSPSTRRILTCTEGSISPISSRKSVPPAACSNRPIRRSVAPVKAPFSCPKSSLSSSCGESAAQWTATNGFSARGLRAWIALAATSLPVPLSPVISTVALLGATWRIVSKTLSIAGERPIILSGARDFTTSRLSSTFSRLSARSRRERRTSISSLSMFTGLVTKS